MSVSGPQWNQTEITTRPSMTPFHSEIETISENHFCNQMIGRARNANTEPKVNFPPRRDVQVNGRENLLLLTGNRVEARDRANRPVVFKPSGDFRSEVVVELEIR